MSIDPEKVYEFASAHLDDVNLLPAWGEQALFYNPGNQLKRGTYFATVKEKNGENDQASQLDRTNVWRLNIGINKKTFEEMFGPAPARPPKGGIIEGEWNFAALDTITPHPVYGWMNWIAICCPSDLNWKHCQELLRDAHVRAVKTFQKRSRNK